MPTVVLPSRSIINSYEFNQNAGKFLTVYEQAFLSYASTFKEVCFASDRTLAIAINCSVATVYRVIKSLIKKGIIFKEITMKGFHKIRKCYVNYQTIKNLLCHFISKNNAQEPSLRRFPSNHRDGIHPITETDNSIKEESIKDKGTDEVRYCTWQRKGFKKITERSITKIVGIVAGHISYQSLTAFEKEVYAELGGENLKQFPAKLYKLCGSSSLDYFKVLAISSMF